MILSILTWNPKPTSPSSCFSWSLIECAAWKAWRVVWRRTAGRVILRGVRGGMVEVQFSSVQFNDVYVVVLAVGTCSVRIVERRVV